MQVSGFDDDCRLTPLRRLYPLPVRQASNLPSASFRFPVARDTLAARLTLPLAGCVEDLHLQVTRPATTASRAARARSAPCLAHKNKAAQKAAMSLNLWWPWTESNCRHADFQSAALPTELPGHGKYIAIQDHSVRPPHMSATMASSIRKNIRKLTATNRRLSNTTQCFIKK